MHSRTLLAAMAALAAGASLAQAAVQMVTGNISTNTTWTSANEYVLDGTIYVTGGATLTIQPGTVVRLQPKASGLFNPGALVVAADGTINAVGTAGNPIIFTTAAVESNTSTPEPDGWEEITNGSGSSGYYEISAERYNSSSPKPFWDANPKTAPKSYRYTGLGGGIVILGTAPTNYDGNTGTAAQDRTAVEGLSAGNSINLYGGTDYADSSGAFAYVSLRHMGASLAANNELNGLTLAGVGSGTRVDHVEIWGNTDDGVEIFGGTVNLSHLAIFGARDDGFDIDQGWNGYAQFISVVAGANTDKLAEIDGDDGTLILPNGYPLARAQIYNFTGIGYTNQTNPFSSNAGIGFDIRDDSGYSFFNSIITNIESASANWLNVNNNNTQLVTLSNFTVWPSKTEVVGGSATTPSYVNLVKGEPAFYPFLFSDASSGGVMVEINPLPAVNAALEGTFNENAVFQVATPPPGAEFIVPASYRGAFDPAATVLWTNGWTAAEASGTFGPALNGAL